VNEADDGISILVKGAGHFYICAVSTTSVLLR